jgi:hypothetical protein
MRRARHGLHLGTELVAYAIVNRAWWVLPVVLALGLAALGVIAGQVVAPYTLYTVF